MGKSNGFNFASTFMGDYYVKSAQLPDDGASSSEPATQPIYKQARKKDGSDMIKGCPSILVPISPDWSPSERDKFAPSVLPSRSFMGNMRVAGKVEPGRPLDEIPASFRRPVPPRDATGPTYSSFKPFYLPGLHSNRIAKGFEPRYPGPIMVDHDVSAVDWDRFLMNLRIAGALRSTDYRVANQYPGPMASIGAVYGRNFSTDWALRYKEDDYIPDVLALVETYQHHFFVPRKLDVFVACGNQRLTGYYPSDRSHLASPPVEIGLRIIGSDIPDVPELRSKSVFHNVFKKPKSKEARQAETSTMTRQEGIDAYKRQIVSRRTAELNAERKAGMMADKQGKFRLVVQPLGLLQS